MITFTLKRLSMIGSKYHYWKGCKYDSKSNKFAYHIQLSKNYLTIYEGLCYKKKLKDKLFK